MPIYAYTARDGTGAPLSGTLSAASETEVIHLLRREGKYATSVEFARDSAGGGASGSGPALSAGGIKLPRIDVIQISQQLSIMVETGVTLTEALECIANQTDKPKIKAMV